MSPLISTVLAVPKQTKSVAAQCQSLFGCLNSLSVRCLGRRQLLLMWLTRSIDVDWNNELTKYWITLFDSSPSMYVVLVQFILCSPLYRWTTTNCWYCRHYANWFRVFCQVLIFHLFFSRHCCCNSLLYDNQFGSIDGAPQTSMDWRWCCRQFLIRNNVVYLRGPSHLL